MRDCVNWLLRIENESADIYKLAAKLFAEDKEFEELLNNLAADEENHHELIEKASDILKNTEESSLKTIHISVDKDTRDRLREPLVEFTRALEDKTMLSQDKTLGYIIDTEFSELNDLFAYIIVDPGTAADRQLIVSRMLWNIDSIRNILAVEFIANIDCFEVLSRQTAPHR